MKVYLDVSCLNRPFDNQNQARIRLESAAVTMIFDEIDAGRWEQVASRMSEIEIQAITDDVRRRRVVQLLPERKMELTAEIFRRAREFVQHGLGAADAVHLSAAEAVGADVLLTCDDRFLRRTATIANPMKVRVTNPIEWLKEQIDATKS
jgi:predicted nucleic acid-binding protein